MTKAFLVTGGEQFDALWRVVLSIHKSQLDWVYETFLGLLVNAADPKAWVTGGETTPAEAAAIFEQIIKDIVMYPTRVGEVFAYLSTTPPPGCLPCDGATYLKADYPDLAAVLADSALDISDTEFTTPIMPGKFPLGTDVQADIGTNGGAADVTLTTGNLASHQHSVHGHGAALAVAPGELPVSIPSLIPDGTGFTGSNDPFDIIPPYTALAYYVVALDPWNV